MYERVDTMDNNQVEFKGTVVKCVYSSPNFKTYALDVDDVSYPNIKHNKFDNVSLIGDLSDLVIGIEYDVVATEEQTKYGISYRAVNVRRDMPTRRSDIKAFLQEILTIKQAEVLYENYPDIIDIVIEGKDDIVDVNKLHGIGEKTFERIKEKIIENFKLVDLVAEFKGAISLSMIKRIYDKYTDIDVLMERLKDEPYTTLTRVSGVGYKTADSIIINLQKEGVIDFGYDVKTSKDRCLACIIYLLKENEDEGNTKMNLADLRKQCYDMVPSCADHFVNAIQDSTIYYDKSTMAIALSSTFNKEKYIAYTIMNNIFNQDNAWDFDVEKYSKVGEFELSYEQMKAVENLCKYNISILNGAGGTGKSFSTQAVINMLDDNGKRYELFSPTGKAAKVLSGFTGRRASTIHRGLGYNPRVGWTYNKDCKLYCDVVIVDECSMVDVSLFAHLIDAIDFKSTKLMLIGDNAQLPSVGCGNLFHDFMQSKAIPTTTLTKVFRYGEGGVSTVATDTRFCKTYLDTSMKNKATWFGTNKDYVFIDLVKEDVPKNAVALYKKLLKNGEHMEDIQVLTAKNIGEYGAIKLNNMIQKAVNKNYGAKRCMKVGDVQYYDDDIVVQKQNNYSALICDTRGAISEEEGTAFVANGETARIVYACATYAVLDFDGVLVNYSKYDMTMVGLAYAMTIHKSQGSSIKNVILCTTKSDIFMLNSNLLYVGVSRTKNHCYHLGSIDAVNMAVKKKANLSRQTFMQEFMNLIGCMQG
nr:MAG TPA: ATP dependent DNA helicase [Caudoviricetes sp.]